MWYSDFDKVAQEWITGQTPRVESGIEVNGLATDKYELSAENLQGVAGGFSGRLNAV